MDIKNLDDVEHNLVEQLENENEMFVALARKAIDDYANDNGVGPADDPDVFGAWITWLIKSGFLSGVETAFNTLRGNGRLEIVEGED